MEPPALSPLPQASKRRSERWRRDCAWPPATDARKKAEAVVKPCWAGTGAISAPRSPLSAPQRWSTCALPVLAPSHSHTQEVQRGRLPSPPSIRPKIRPSINFFPVAKTHNRPRKTEGGAEGSDRCALAALCLHLGKKRKYIKQRVQSTSAEVCVSDPRRANGGVVSTQAFSSAGHDKLLG